jgi:hypothetical protein
MKENIILDIWVGWLFKLINNYVLIRFHDESFHVNTDVLDLHYVGDGSTRRLYKFKLDWFILELKKQATTIKSLKSSIAKFKTTGIIYPLNFSKSYVKQINPVGFVKKVQEVEEIIRKTFQFKTEFLGYRGDPNPVIHNNKEKNFIKETFTSISMDIFTSRTFMEEENPCCFYFYFVDPTVTVIPVFKYVDNQAELLLVPGLFYQYVSFGGFEVKKTQYSYYVYYVRPYQSGIQTYNKFTTKQLQAQKKQMMKVIAESNADVLELVEEETNPVVVHVLS